MATKIEGQGYHVSSKQGSSEITVKGNKPIDASRINKDIIVESLAQIIEKKEKIKDLNINYKYDQLGREISKLLNATSQKENINSNYNDGEPIFQTREEASNYPLQKKDINSNSVRGNYNDGVYISDRSRSTELSSAKESYRLMLHKFFIFLILLALFLLISFL